MRQFDMLSFEETEKFIADALKQSFPDVSFILERVRRVVVSILAINWTGGPTRNQVADITGDYLGKGIDIIRFRRNDPDELDVAEKFKLGSRNPVPRRSCFIVSNRIGTGI